MATRNFVPRANGEGSLGKERKYWGAVYVERLFVKTIIQFSDILKNVLYQSGVRWNFGTNGFLCFGGFFGNFVIEYVYFNTNNSDAKNEQEVLLPLALKKMFYGHIGVFGYGYPAVGASSGLTPDLTKFRIKFDTGRDRANPVYGIVIGCL